MSTLAVLAAGSFVSALWQGALLTAVVAILLRLVPGISAAARSALWGSVFLLVIGLHFVPARGTPAMHHARPAWSLAVAGLWLACSVLRGSQLILGAIHLRALAHRAVPVEPPRSISAGPLRRAAVLCTSAEVDRPSVIGFFFPRIVLPPRLSSTLAPQELEQVLLHEAGHLQRGDDWTNLLQKVALVLFPLNPALHWVERRLCQERELACDDRVLAATHMPKAYALCLTSLAEYAARHRTLSLALGAWQRQSELTARIHRILSRPGSSLTRTQTIAVTSAVLCALAGGACTLARSPQLLSFAPEPQAVASAIHLPALGTPGALPTAAVAMERQSPPRPVLARVVVPVRQTRLSRISSSVRPLQTAQAVRRRRLMQEPKAVPIALTEPRTPSQRPTLGFVLTRTILSSDTYPESPAFVPPALAVRVPEGWLVIQL